jgi:hypothetical protein
MTNPVGFKGFVPLLRRIIIPQLAIYWLLWKSSQCELVPSFVTQCATASQAVWTSIVAREWLPLFPHAFSFSATFNTATSNFFVCSVHTDCISLLLTQWPHSFYTCVCETSKHNSYVLAAVVMKSSIFQYITPYSPLQRARIVQSV